MKLVVLQDYLRTGGTEHQALWLADVMRSRDVETHLVTFRPGGALAGKVIARGLDWTVLQPFDSRCNFWAPRLGDALQRLAPDVVIAMGREANGKLPQVRRTLPQVRLVATLRTGRRLPRAYRRGLELADRIVTNADWGKAMLARQGIGEGRITVIPNALHRQWVWPEVDQVRAAVRKEEKVAAGEKVLLSLGTFKPGKGQSTTLSILAQLKSRKDWRLWLVGDGPLRTRCERQARELGLDGRVKFWGRMADPFGPLCACDIVVHTSASEGLPNALVEAQCVGRPFIAYNVAGVPECYLEGQSGKVVDYGDEQSFSTGLQELMDNDSQRQTWGEQAAAWARKHFAPQGIVDRYTAVLFNLARMAID